MYLRNEDFERAVLLMRSGRSRWPDADAKFGAQNAQPEEELMLLKDIFLTADLCEGGECFVAITKEFLINFISRRSKLSVAAVIWVEKNERVRVKEKNKKSLF